MFSADSEGYDTAGTEGSISAHVELVGEFMAYLVPTIRSKKR